MNLHSRTVLIDLERQEFGQELLAAGLHPLELSPARLPCSLQGDDLARIHAFALGHSTRCEVMLSFRLQDLDDLGVPSLQLHDCLTGVFELCGTKLVELPQAKRLRVAATFVGGSGLSLGRPGRHLLCAQFTSESSPILVATTPIQVAAENAAPTSLETVAD